MPWSSLPRDLELGEAGQLDVGKAWLRAFKDVLVVPRHWFHAAMASGLEPTATLNVQLE